MCVFCSVESIEGFIPLDDAPLLRHIRKQKKRAERRRNAGGSDRKSHKDFEQLFGSDDMTVRRRCPGVAPHSLLLLADCHLAVLLWQEAEGLDDNSDGDAGFDALPKARANTAAPYKRYLGFTLGKGGAAWWEAVDTARVTCLDLPLCWVCVCG